MAEAFGKEPPPMNTRHITHEAAYGEPKRTVLVFEPVMDRQLVAVIKERYWPVLRAVPSQEGLPACERLAPQRAVWLTSALPAAACEDIRKLRAAPEPLECHIFLKPTVYNIRLALAAGVQGCFALPAFPGPGRTERGGQPEDIQLLPEISLVVDAVCARMYAGGLSGGGAVPPFDLTETERKMLHALARSVSNEDIARQFACAESTVRAAWTALQRRTGTDDRCQLLLWAIRNGVVSPWAEDEHGV